MPGQRAWEAVEVSRLLVVVALLCMIVGAVFYVVNDPHLPYGERRAGWEVVLFVGGALGLLYLWIWDNHRAR